MTCYILYFVEKYKKLCGRRRVRTHAERSYMTIAFCQIGGKKSKGNFTIFRRKNRRGSKGPQAPGGVQGQRPCWGVQGGIAPLLDFEFSAFKRL